MDNDYYLVIVEKWLIVLVTLFMTLLIITQSFLYLPGTAPYLNTALRLEGEPLDASNYSSFAGNILPAPWASISLRLVNYISMSEVKVYIDGEEITNFLQNEVTIPVKQGSVVSIFNPDKNRIITVILEKSSPNITKPVLDSIVQGTGMMYFEPVILK